PLITFFLFSCSSSPRVLPSFPTRRSSDLFSPATIWPAAAAMVAAGGVLRLARRAGAAVGLQSSISPSAAWPCRDSRTPRRLALHVLLRRLRYAAAAD